jgi:hypothetical protein
VSECTQLLQTIASWIAAFGTLLLAAVAIWGEPLRRWLAKPKLTIKRPSELGSITPLNRKGGDEPVQARYFHCEVGNTARRFPFRDVRLMLEQLDVMRSGEWAKVWDGRVPLRWRHEERVMEWQVNGQHQVVPLSYEPKQIGASWHADLFSVTSEKKFQIQPFIVPTRLNHALSNEIDPNEVNVRMTIRAISVDGDSEPLRVIVKWDGQWVDGENEMGSHLRVTTE